MSGTLSSFSRHPSLRKAAILLFLPLLLQVLRIPLHAASQPGQAERPNIVYILADDLGYGDVRCLNADGRIPTPNIDRLAREGMVFTDAHSSSAVCTPSRYSILTGRYCWRTRLQTGVLDGTSPALIDPERLTVADLLRKNGYQTACIGKWHLGMELPNLKDWQQPIRNGPTAHGFDYFYGISASLDMPPYVFLENDRITENPSVEKPEGFGLQLSRKGPGSPGFDPVDVLPAITRRSVEYIDRCKGSAHPFFLYLALPSPHTPILPAPEWKGKSGIGDYGDYVMETDWSVGQVLDALDRNGFAKDTLVIFTSDNGCSPRVDLPALAKLGHHPSHVFRGAKSDIWDGGHRIPFIVRWPGNVKAGTSCDQTVSLGDFTATTADLLSSKLPDHMAEDSFSILPALLGKASEPPRALNIYHSIDGCFAIQEGRWKLELCPGSGGWSRPSNAEASVKGMPRVQLYDMHADISERKNVQAEHPDIVRRLTQMLEKCVAEGRSTSGSPVKNDAAVEIWKIPSPKLQKALESVGN